MNYFIKTSFLIILGIIVGTTQTCAQQEFKRNIEMRTFIPKGQWIVGNSVSYSQYSNDNYQFLVIENLSGEGYAFKVSPVLCYAFKDNVAAGGRFMYSRTYTKLNNISVNIDEDTNFDISNLYELKNSYSGIAVLRNYINLGTSKRFALFNEVQLELGGSVSKVVNGKGDDLTGVYQTSLDASVGLSPGLVAFINNYTAVEVSIGVLGLNVSRTHQVTDRIYESNRSSMSANFKINLFSIGLGIAFYL